MTRWASLARLLVVALLTGAATFTLAPSATAFHTGSTFAAPADEGGGGGIFYVGMPLERGWNCTMCHEDPPGRMEIRLDVDPPQLFQTFRYQPGASYAFSVRMVWKDGATELGLGSGRSNFNALAVGVSDSAGLFAGTLQGGGFDGGSGGGTIASNVGDGVTAWKFNWFAPAEAGRGRVTLFFGAVDGNGANSDPELTRSDPFGDDVFMAEVTLEEEGGSTTQAPRGTLTPASRRAVPASDDSRFFRARASDDWDGPTLVAKLASTPAVGLSLLMLALAASLARGGWRRSVLRWLGQSTER